MYDGAELDQGPKNWTSPGGKRQAAINTDVENTRAILPAQRHRCAPPATRSRPPSLRHQGSSRSLPARRTSSSRSALASTCTRRTRTARPTFPWSKAARSTSWAARGASSSRRRGRGPNRAIRPLLRKRRQSNVPSLPRRCLLIWHRLRLRLEGQEGHWCVPPPELENAATYAPPSRLAKRAFTFTGRPRIATATNNGPLIGTLPLGPFRTQADPAGPLLDDLRAGCVSCKY